MTTPADPPEGGTEPPGVGDVVEYAPGRTAIVTDVRAGVPWLRNRYSFTGEWPADAPAEIRVVRRRAEREREWQWEGRAGEQ
ncbi:MULTISPECIES: hypothetical protein [Streptomyces]|uniref:hypothetical protein n=1 Tax=Streptomyces TaxID=1883 RepID=UPI00069A9141|nr:hypothetical protein [Streptomyces sp. SID7805]